MVDAESVGMLSAASWRERVAAALKPAVILLSWRSLPLLEARASREYISTKSSAEPENAKMAGVDCIRPSRKQSLTSRGIFWSQAFKYRALRARIRSISSRRCRLDASAA